MPRLTKPKPEPTPRTTTATRESRGLPSATATAKLLTRVRALCMALPDAIERPSHGAPTWFIANKRSFATFADDHHADGRVALVCAAPEGAQAALVDDEPDRYYVPPYVGRAGWIGVRLDRDTPWPEIERAVEHAYQTAVTKRRR